VSGPLAMARAFAGPDASDAGVAWMLYKLLRVEHEMWWGETKSFPAFDEWLQRQPVEKD